jgi:hypothetical protein
MWAANMSPTVCFKGEVALKAKSMIMLGLPMLLGTATVATGATGGEGGKAWSYEAAAASQTKAARSGIQRTTQIPRAFRGSWGMANPCHPDSDMQMHVQSRVIHFYEDTANVRSVAVESPTRLTLGVDLHIAGDDGSSEQTLTMELRDNGTRVVVRYAGSATPPNTYVRCTSTAQP